MIIHSEQEMLTFGRHIGKELAMSSAIDHQSTSTTEHTEKGIVRPSHPTVIELIGDVGAGKTTFVRGLAQGLGVREPVTSPSFTISKSYALPSGDRLVHYDFYRLTDPGLMSKDLQEELSNPANIIVIEWGESISTLLPDNRIAITIQKTDTNSRTIDIKNNQINAPQNSQQSTKDKSAKICAPKDAATNPTESSSMATNPAESLGIATDPRESSDKAKQTPTPTIRLYLDTSTPETILKLNNQEYRYDFGHDLAEKLLQFMHDKLAENNKSWQDLSSITFMSGPGSFTGLRIGATIVNTLAHELNVPLKDHHGNLVKAIIPDYGRPANITQPKK